ncbi:hypothetical protein J1605_016181 [Eschrichtius robustus]|uniref:F-box only protein 25 n=1 Tax=Eschrichtius robustus TaxID=9764 RepID=A0AB34G8K2_ESCRO|nr:hypothetical protein J1605_016181 [Eschrichtius robustus]
MDRVCEQAWVLALLRLREHLGLPRRPPCRHRVLRAAEPLTEQEPGRHDGQQLWEGQCRAHQAGGWGGRCDLLQLIAKSQLTSLSGVAQKNYFNVLDKIVQKVLDDHQNPRLIKDLLQDLSSTLCILIRGVGKSVLVGNINIWVCRLETILNWQQQLQNLQMTEQVDSGLTLSDLPVHMLSNILYRFSDGWDIVTLGQVTPTLSALSEDRRLWKKLCQYHFGEKQFCRHLILSEKGHIEWKLMYFALQKHYPTKEQYGDTLHFCRHCSILFWKGHLALILAGVPAAYCGDAGESVSGMTLTGLSPWLVPHHPAASPQFPASWSLLSGQTCRMESSTLRVCGRSREAAGPSPRWWPAPVSSEGGEAGPGGWAGKRRERQDSGHPCTAADPDSCFMPVSPQHFIDLFKF